MSIKDIWTRLRTKLNPPPPEPQKEAKTLETLTVYDDVRLYFPNGDICEGWIMERTIMEVSIVYTDKDNKLREVTLPLRRPFNVTKFTSNNITVLCL